MHAYYYMYVQLCNCNLIPKVQSQLVLASFPGLHHRPVFDRLQYTKTEGWWEGGGLGGGGEGCHVQSNM